MSRTLRIAAVGALASMLILAACQAAASNSPAASSAASAAASVAPLPSPTPVPTPVATVPSGELGNASKLVTCIDIPYPPQEFFDDKGNPTGADPDISNEIAKRLGLESVIENSVFDTIIAALTASKCDIIVSAQNITKERLGQVSMIPYFQAGQAFVVAKGNPKAIKTELDLCGKKAAAESGTTEVDYMNGTGDYKTDGGLKKKCADAGKAPVDAKEFQKDTDALLALSAGQVDAYFADSPVAGYYTVQKPDQFELSGITLNSAVEGISVTKDHKGLSAAVVAALKSMMADGTYLQILKKYGLQDGAVKDSDVAVQTGS